MTGPIAHLLGFGGGVVKEGAADTQRTDELRSCDGYDIGPRGALIAAKDAANYATVNDLATVPGPWSKLHAIRSVAGSNFTKSIVVGEGLVTATARYLLGQFVREGATTPVTGATAIKSFSNAIAVRSEGVQVTIAQFPGVYPITNAAQNINVFLINIGAREGFAANVAPGLYVAYTVPPSDEILLLPISTFDALGTGSRGEFATGSNSQQLYFRGIAAYGPNAIGWGFDAQGGTDKEGPSRLMFSNLNKPLKWGNDNVAAAGTNRLFTDSDAIYIGDGGENIRAGLTWNTRFWIGTDKQLHYLAGNGRDSFITDGANPVAKAENVLGPNCLIEGPNKLLFGVGDLGLWEFDGSSFERHHQRLRDFSGSSLDYWDLIWTDRLRSDVYPGKTNADLVWLAVDWDNEQVVIGVPWCNASSGRGYGTDTVIIKHNVRTKGFSRQVFIGVQYTAGDYVRRQRQFRTSRMLGTGTSGVATVRKYGDPSAGASIPTPLPKFKAGPYALYGPDGVGVYRKAYVTLAWEPPFSGLGDWTSRVNPVDVAFKDVIWTGTYFVAVASATAGNRVMRSLDGIAWTAHASANDAYSWTRLAFSSTLGTGQGRLVAVCNLTGSDEDEAMYSDDQGATWTLCVTPAYGGGTYFSGVAWSPTLALFVAVGGATGRIMSSVDGITWTDRATPSASTWTAVAWSPSLAKFVAISATSGNVMTSVNGTVWVNSATFPAAQYSSLIWSSRLALFVAVGIAGVATSPDGTTWTVQTAAAANHWRGIIDAAEIGLLVATSIDGTGNRVMTSTDGVTWTLAASAADNEWYAVAWSSTLTMLAAVASTGAGNRVMTNSPLPTTPDLAFNITPYVDGEALSTMKVSVRPTAPSTAADGDLWLDTSGTDTNIGNATAGTLVAAAADYLVKVRYRSAWQYTGFGGQKGERATVPIAFTPKRGTRLEMLIETVTANRRWQFEGMGFSPAAVSAGQ